MRFHCVKYSRGDLQRMADRVEPAFNLPLEAREDAREAGPSWTIVDYENGRAVACGGAMQLWPGVAEIWLAVSKTMAGHPLPLIKTLIEKRREIIDLYGFSRLQASVRADFDTGRNLAIKMGFRCEGYLHAYNRDGSDAMIFAFIA